MPAVVLVHHADAVGPDVDAARPLSAHGRAQAEHAAAQAVAAGVRPAAIWHSGKLRARQTAEYFWRLCNPLADFRMVRGLRPDDSAEWMRDVLQDEGRDVLLVSHMPLLPALLTVLLRSPAHFPLNGWVMLDHTVDGFYAEQRRSAPHPTDLPG